MAFEVGSVKISTKGAVVATGNGGYGLGAKNLNVASTLYVNRYAKVTAVNGKKITIGNTSGTTNVSNVCKNSFKAGEEILLHSLFSYQINRQNHKYQEFQKANN